MKSKYVYAIFMVGISSMAVAGPYGGLAIGKVDYDLDGFSKSTGFEIYVGNKFNKNISAELNYVDFGEADDGVAPVWTVSASSIGAAAKFVAPMSEKADIYARVGVHAWDAKLDEAGTGTLDNDSGTDLFFGFGGAFYVSESLALGIRYTMYEADGDDVSILGANVEARF